MNYILDKDGFKILKNSINVNEVKKELTVTPIVKNTYNQKIESYEIYKDDNEYLYVPKFWGLNKYQLADNIIERNDKISVKFNGQLRDYQQKIVDTVMPIITSKGGGIISLPCGDGKTCIAIHIFTKLKLKTLVIVHKSFLLDQWKESISKFTDAKIGLIRSNIIDVDDKDIVIGMLQSLSMKDYHSSIFKKFDLLIVDEVHNIATKVFSKALPKINVPYTIGLSATPKRDDGLSKVFYWFLGDMIFQKEKKKNNSVNVNVLKFKIDEDSHEIKKYREVKTRTGDPNLALMITNISEVDSRNNMIVKQIDTILKEEPERNILILSSRIEQLHILKEKTDIKLPNNPSGFYIGKMKPKELKKSEENQIIYATYEMVNEGFDLPKLNTLIFATPRSKIEQAVGRIMRQQSFDINPLIVDIIDEIGVFKGQWFKRCKYYKNLNYKLEFISDDVKKEKVKLSFND
jgi:superfamily II DNA or RNA helicase